VAQAAAIDEQVPALIDPSRLLLVDGHSMAYRAFYSHPVENFSTTTGQPRTRCTGSPR
jgi:DNA polymerase-1